MDTRRRTIALLVTLSALGTGLLVGGPLAGLAIDGYQRFISPHKGYHCAFATYYHGPTCSAYGKEAIAEHGLLTGLALLKHRFDECEHAKHKVDQACAAHFDPRMGVPRLDAAGGCSDCGECSGVPCGDFSGGFCGGFAAGCL